jgi:hypothetical protein
LGEKGKKEQANREKGAKKQPELNRMQDPDGLDRSNMALAVALIHPV